MEVLLPQTIYITGGNLSSRHLASLTRNNFFIHTTKPSAFDYALLLGDGRYTKANLPLLRATTDGPIICGGDLSSLERAAVLDHGADGVVSIDSISSEELLAHLRAIARLKNLKATAKVQTSLDIDDRNRLHYGNQTVDLVAKEGELFRLLSTHAGKPLKKDRIMNHLYGGMDEPSIKIVDVFVCKLRKQLKALGCPTKTIETVWAHGYQFNWPPYPTPLAT